MAAAAYPLAAGDNAYRRQWRYTWETLAHLPILRLYLFRHPALPAGAPCGLRSDLRLDASLLLVSFSLPGGEEPVTLKVPVPRVLVDPSAPPECRAAGDHVEVRLTLVLPVDHPVVAAAFPGTETPAPLALRDDLKSLSSADVHLYCKTCSARLTRQPIRDIMEMPSLNWEDVADNWFGGCCTSFGGASEKLVSQYINAYGRLEGTTLLDATSIIIEKDHLEMDLASSVASSAPGIDFVALQEAISDVSVENGHATETIQLDNSEQGELCGKNIGCSHMQPTVVLEKGSCVDKTETNGGAPWADQSDTPQLETDFHVNIEKPKNDCCTGNIEKPTDLSLEDPCSCFCDSGESGNKASMPSRDGDSQMTLDNQRDYKLRKSISLGSSFIVKESNLLKDVDWIELLCAHCSSCLGSYPSACSHVPADGRVRLFKCYTSSDLHIGGPRDVFRGHTLGKLFVNLLLETAEDEISFRTVVRDLKTKRPMLQIVLLSSKAWLFSGYCYENDTDGSHGTAHLQPAVKILYSDCSNASEVDIRIVELWSSKYRAEELYMMGRQINELIEGLSSASDMYPLSCSSLEGLYVSSLER